MPGTNRNNDFELQILTPEKGDLYFCSWDSPLDLVWQLVRKADEAGFRCIGDVQDWGQADAGRIRRIMKACSGVVAVFSPENLERAETGCQFLTELQVAAELSLPLAVIREEGAAVTSDSLHKRLHFQIAGEDQVLSLGDSRLYWDEVPEGFSQGFLTEISTDHATARPRPYAFLIGRLESDFTHAREAIRSAVESEAGIPCLWSDDGRHRTNVEGVRKRTGRLIQHAAFVIADVTLGVENPNHENPSRAHEIGLAVAYGHKIMLCSQEPRRYPYFSIADHQMVFWTNEEDLESKVREWIRTRRDRLGRTVLNYALPDLEPDYQPRIAKPRFRYQPNERYIGPRTPGVSSRPAWPLAFSYGVFTFLVFRLLIWYFDLGLGAELASGGAAVAATALGFLLHREGSKKGG